MTTDSKYNGWTNSFTWLVNLHDIVDDETLTQLLLDNATVDENGTVGIDVSDMAEAIKDYVESLIDNIGETPTNGFVADMFNHAMGLVNWFELAENYVHGNVPTLEDMVDAGKVHPDDFDFDNWQATVGQEIVNLDI